MLLVVAGLGAWVLVKAGGLIAFAFSPATKVPSDTLLFEVRRDQPAISVSKELAKKGLVGNARRFLDLGRILRRWHHVKVGEYELSANMTPLDVFSSITSGISVQYSVTVQEGKNLYQIAEELERKKLATKSEIVELAKSDKFMRSLGLKNPLPPSLEGYLFPETYFFNRSLGSRDILRAMFRKFESVWNEKKAARARELGLTRHQVITLASIVEKETGAPEERPRIASVFHNRLKKRMRLASDPTTIYGMWQRYRGNIRRSDLREKNSYNTYAMRGLPVGPIANPGALAIEAVLHPETTPFLYFVSKNDGTHVFSTNLKAHNRAVQKYQVNAKAREGKSWRDLKKRRQKKNKAG